MARIPDDVIERLKQEVSLERLAEARGVKLTRHGADLIGLCPFHDDREPSLVISPKKNLWHCLGACQTGGTVIDWVMRVHGVSFRHAVELLRSDHAGVGAPAEAVKHSTVRKLPPPVERDAGEAALLVQVASFYHDTLKASPDALAYLGKRGLTDPEMIERFRLGFANRTLGYRLPASNRNAGAEMRGRLQSLGILRESGHEHFNGSLVIPIFNAAGGVAQMYGRKITENLRAGTPLHLYLPGPHRGVWNEEALAASKEIILCESLIDALTFWCAGYRNVISSYGINGFTDDHRAALKEHGTQRVLIAYDRDEAGEKAAQSLADELMDLGIECFRILFPRGMDANEYALKVTPAAKSLGVLINKAQWLGKGNPPQPAAKEETTTKTDPVLSLAAAPAAAAIDVPVEIKAEETVITFDDRRYRVRGLAKNLSYDLLKVNVLAWRGDGFHVDTLDLYSARQRVVFVKQAAVELVLTVNEDRQQTQAIHRLQREQQTLEGLLARQERDGILKLHRNAQRLLKPLFVVNPYARELTFLDSQTRTRRDHTKYLALIRSIALLHQYQRRMKTAEHGGRSIEYIEVTPADIEVANRLAHEVLGRSLDELPPQTRRLLLLIDEMVRSACERDGIERAEFRFSRREVRLHTGWGDTQLRVHLHRLEELEYLLVHRGGRGQSFVYELVFDGQGADGRPVLPGLIDAGRLHVYDEKNAGLAQQNAGSTRGQNGRVAGRARVAPEAMNTGLPSDFSVFRALEA